MCMCVCRKWVRGMAIEAVNSAHMDVVNRDRIAHRSRLRNVIGPRSAFGFCTESVVSARPTVIG